MLVDDATGLIQVYRVIGTGFWLFVANPADPTSTGFAYLEVLLALAVALKRVADQGSVEDRLNARLQM